MKLHSYKLSRSANSPSDQELEKLIRYVSANKKWYAKGVKTTTLYMYPQMVAAAYGVSKVIPQGFHVLVGVVSDHYMTIAYDPRDFKPLGHKLLRKVQKNSNFLQNYRKNFLYKSRDLRNYAKIIYGLRRISDVPTLIETLQQLFYKALATQSHGYITEIFTTTDDSWVKEYMEWCGVVKEQDQQSLMQPIADTFLQKIAKEVDKCKSKQGFQKLLRNYYWIHGSYWNLPKLELSDIKRMSHGHEGINRKTTLINRSKIIGSCKRPQQLAALLELLDNFSAIQDERKANVLITNYALHKIVDITTKLYPDLSQQEITELTVDELLDLYQKRINQSVVKKIAKERSVKNAWIFSPKGYTISTNPQLYNKIAKLVISPVKHAKELRGISASSGIVTGKVRIVLSEQEFKSFHKGEVLVTSMTRPEFLPIMKKAKAFITNEGGITSHAAIVARELNKPCVIGTKVATKVFKDGDMVEVDANKGIIKFVK